MKPALPGVALLLLAVAVPVAPAAAQAAGAKPAPQAASSPKPAAAVTAPAAPAAPPVLEGVVKGPDGKPLDKALVVAQPETTTGNSDPPLNTRTDVDGRFRLPLKGRGTHMVRVESSGLASQTLPKVQPGTPLTITLQKGGAIQGRVLDGSTGAPVAGARIEAREERGSTRNLGWEPGAGVVVARSDAQGRFRLEGLAAGFHSVSAAARGFARAQKGSVALGARLDLYVFSGGSLSGTVRDTRNRPLGGARVRVEFETEAMGMVRSMPPPVETTDAAGRFEFFGLNPGSYRVMAVLKDFAPAWVGGIAVDKGGEGRADLVMETGVTVVGRLIGVADRPVPGRAVVQESDGQPPPRAMGDVLRATAGSDGRFRLLLPPGAYVLSAIAPGYASQRVDVTATGKEPTVDAGDVVLETGLTIRGHVRDKAGRPVADAGLMGFRQRSFGPVTSVPEARTEADGAFVLAGLEPGLYDLNVSAPGFGRARREAEAGTESVNFTLTPSGAVSGSAVDDAGRPVDTFRATARPARRETMMVLAPRTESIASPDGRFLLENVGEGEYMLEVSAPDRVSGSVSSVKVTAGSTTEVGPVVLRSGGTIRGTVTDTSGTPVGGAAVSVSGPGLNLMAFTATPVNSDPSGAFELRGVTPGSASLVARHPAYAESRLDGIEVDPAKGPAEARLVMTQGGRVEGRLRKRDGAGIPGANIQVNSGRGGGMFMPGNSGASTTGPDGSFVVEHVLPGRAQVTVFTRGAGPIMANSLSREVEVREGETAQVDIVTREILISGRILRGGAPGAGLRVMFRGRSPFAMMVGAPGGPGAPSAAAGPQPLTGVTTEDGSFQLLVDEPGKYMVRVEPVDGRSQLPVRDVEVPDADAHTVDLSFNSVPVSGIVLEKETERPLAQAFVSFMPKKGSGSSFVPTGTDGRFQLEVDPGDYTMNGRADGHMSERTEVTVGAGGASDLRMLLSQGVSITGRVVDAGGRPVGGISVSASPLERTNTPSGDYASTLPDGSFELSGLVRGPHSLTARSLTGAFAIQPSVNPGGQPVLLTLRPGGRVQLHASGPDGAPVQGAMAMVRKVGAVAVPGISSGMSPTDSQGVLEMMVPAGELEIVAIKEMLEGKALVSVPSAGTVPVEIKLVARGLPARTP